MGKFVDLTGQHFGRLVVIERGEDYIDNQGSKRVQWRCKCECGQEVLVRSSSLRSGVTISCGCLQSEMMKKFNQENKTKKFNYYEFLENGDIKVYSDDKEKFFLVNGDELDKINNKHWCKDKNGYWVTYDKNSKAIVKLHRLITNANKEDIIDHINGDTDDNRQENLRKVTIQQNCMNHKVRANNSSGCTGVSFKKSTGKWFAYIKYKRTIYWLGTYIEKQDAIKARKLAEEKYFGEFARQTF